MSPAGMWSFSVSELAIPGAEIGRISATDADLGENAKLEYTILEGESGDTFNISGVNQEAVITLNKVGGVRRSGFSARVVECHFRMQPSRCSLETSHICPAKVPSGCG